MNCRELNYEELRPLVLEALENKDETQMLEIINSVELLALKYEFYKDCPDYVFGGQVTTHKMPREEREKVREIINDLVIEGVLGWGLNESNSGPPFLKVTRYGKEVLKYAQPQPYDPDGYLKFLKKEIPNIDDVIFMYLAESLNAYLRGLLLSSTVMLGVASEKAFLLLKESFINALPSDRKSDIEKKFQGQINSQFKIFRTYLAQINKQLPRELSDDLEVQLDGVFNFIRSCRNDVGHPTGKTVDRTLAFNNLRLFIPYCKRAYDLIRFFQTQSITNI